MPKQTETAKPEQAADERFKYADIAKNVKAIRQALGKSVMEMSRLTHISRTYITDFERGNKIPTTKYIRYLYEEHRVNANFILSGDGPMFRPKHGEILPVDFGPHQSEVEEMVWCMQKFPHALLHQIQSYIEYKLKYKQLLHDHVPEIVTDLLK